MRFTIAVLAGMALAAGCSQPEDAPAPAEASATEDPNGASETAEAGAADYADMANWLCHPSKDNDACSGDLDYTRVSADGSLEVQTFEAADNPPVDCFYVYPTISYDTTPNSDLDPGEEERRVAATQFGAFGEACRLFAPVYRQITLPHLQSIMAGGEFKADPAMAYGDVKAAWDTYLATENGGRGVVLIGHSQGARMVEQLLREDVIGSDAEDLIVSAMPLGYTIYGDAETGAIGPFEPCTIEGQTGCVISYVSFRSDFPPPAESRFGNTDPDGRRALCVNPAELSGDEGELDARLSRAGFFGIDSARFLEDGNVETPYASMPGMLSAECIEGDGHTWLSVTVSGDPSDPRADDITGDVVSQGETLRDWGLHLIDVNVALGNLVEIVKAQAETWTAAEAADETGPE